MEIVKISTGYRFPYTASKVTAPVVRWLTIDSFFEIEIFAVGAIWILQRFLKPFVFVRAVIDDKIHQNRQISFPGLGNQFVHIVHRAETGIDLIIVRNIITLVCQRGLVAGGQPEDVHPQVFQIVQFADNTPQISNAVSGSIKKTFGIDLIGNFSVPPFFLHSSFLPVFGSFIVTGKKKKFKG